MTTMLEKARAAASVVLRSDGAYCEHDTEKVGRAVLEAIREPSVALHNAGCDSPHQSKPPRVELTDEGYVRVTGFKPASSSGLFTAMIDAVLEERA